MGSAASSEPQIQSVEEDQGARAGVRMTVSSRVVDAAKASKSTEAPSSKQSAAQDSKSEASPKQSSNASGAKSKQQNRAEPVPKPAATPLSLGTEGLVAEYAPDEHLEGLKKHILSTTISAPTDPVWAYPTVEKVTNSLTDDVKRIAGDEASALESIQTTFQRLDSVPKSKPFQFAASVQAETICASDYIAATDCIKSGNPMKCSQLMDSFAECSATYHFKQQAKMAQAPRQL